MTPEGRAPGARAAEDGDTPTAEPRRPRVLLAEDDDASRRVLAGALRALGLEVEEVRDGGRMLVSVTARYRTDEGAREFDLIVTDVRMPVCSGLDVFKGLRAAHRGTPVLIVTGLPTPEVLDAAIQLRARVLLKPLDLDTFETTVLRMLQEAGAPRNPSAG